MRALLRTILLTLAVLSGLLWMQAHAIIAALHDDATIVRLADAALDEPAVRSNIRSFTTDAIVNTAQARGIDLTDSPILALLTGALTSDKAITASAPAWTAATSQLRANLVSRLESTDPGLDSAPLMLDLGPVAKASGVNLPAPIASALGMATKNQSFTVQVASGEQMQTLKQRYGYLVLIDRWAGWLALALLVGGVLMSRHPIRALTIASGIAALAALAVRPLIERIGEWATGLGNWGVLARPLTDAVGEHAGPLSTTVATWCGIVAIAGLLGLIGTPIVKRLVTS